MLNVVLGILTFILVLVALFVILLVLMQKAKSDGGMGSAMGGGMAEATFGADTGNVLSKATINASVALFVLSFALYLGRIWQHSHASAGSEQALPSIAVPAAPTAAPASPLKAPAALPQPSAPGKTTP